MSENSKISKAQQKAVHKYVKNNYDRVELTVKPKGKKEAIKAHAEQNGETLNSFINRAINETMNRDNQQQESPTHPQEPAAPAAHASPAQSSALFLDKKALEEAAAKIDLKRLPNDILYQMDIAEALGTDALATLPEKARQQPTESEE